MSKRSWEAVKYPEGLSCPEYNVCTNDGQDIVAEVYDLDGDGGEYAAKLIAAAPEMLAELKSILDVLETRKIGLHRQKTIRQVIAKIEEPVL